MIYQRSAPPRHFSYVENCIRELSSGLKLWIFSSVPRNPASRTDLLRNFIILKDGLDDKLLVQRRM